MKLRWATFGVVTVLALGVSACQPSSGEPSPKPLAECASEGSSGPCVWDADRRGNGEGRSFVVDADGVVRY